MLRPKFKCRGWEVAHFWHKVRAMNLPKWTRLLPGARFVIGVPYLWLAIFFVVPFLILVRISMTDMGNGIDPFAPLLSAADGVWHIVLKRSEERRVGKEC